MIIIISTTFGVAGICLNIFWQRDFLGTPVNLLWSPQKCQGLLLFSPNLSRFITFAAAPLVLTPFVRNQKPSTSPLVWRTFEEVSTWLNHPSRAITCRVCRVYHVIIRASLSHMLETSVRVSHVWSATFYLTWKTRERVRERESLWAMISVAPLLCGSVAALLRRSVAPALCCPVTQSRSLSLSLSPLSLSPLSLSPLFFSISLVFSFSWVSHPCPSLSLPVAEAVSFSTRIYIYIYIYISLSIYIYIYIYIYTYMRVGRCGAQMFGIFYVEKGVLTCTRVHILNNRCSHAGENTIS